MLARRQINRTSNVLTIPKKGQPNKRNATTWTKGNAPMTKGRPKIPADFAQLMKDYSVDAAHRIRWMVDNAEDEKTQLQASIYIINRAYGMPVQANELSGPGGSPLSPPSLVVNFTAPISKIIDQTGKDI